MQVIENSKVKEKLYTKKLENGLTIMVIPKKNIKKKYIIWGTNYGSIDNKFISPGDENATEIPDGVAHFLEHKMFEQENGTNSLDTLTAIGVNANAYTTNDHTAYLYECTDNFDEALQEFMDYVQHPYFTDENVEKEKGIIGQEIMMYQDYPEWSVYLNAMKAIYHNHPVKLDIAGSIESISKINKDILYKCYNTFYHPSNMVLVVCGDFEPEKICNKIEKHLIKTEAKGEIKRIYPEEPEEIVQPKIEQKMEVSIPLFTIAIKDVVAKGNEKIKKHIAIEIILNILLGQSSSLYQELYQLGLIYNMPSLDYEFSKNYAHVVISGQSNKPEEVFEKIQEQIKKIQEKGIEKKDIERIKKMLYGDYIREFDDVASTARMFLADFIKEINSFDYLELIDTVNKQYIEQILKQVFKKDKMALSIIKS